MGHARYNTLNQNSVVVEVADSVSSKKKSVVQVLLVDDDSSFLEISKLILSEMDEKLQFDHAISVNDAFKKIATRQYDIIISDYAMPQKNGLQFLEELRKQNHKIPFILFTGKGMEEVAIKALNLGADGYINKEGNSETVYGELFHLTNQILKREKAERLQTESEAKFKQVFATAPDAMCISTLNEGQFIEVNDRLAEMLGYTKQEMIGKTSADLGFWCELVEREKLKAKLKSNEKIRSMELLVKRKTGEIFPIQLSVSLVKLDNRNFVLSILRDISSIKKGEAELARSQLSMRSIVDSTSDMIWSVSSDDFVLLDFNQSLKDYFLKNYGITLEVGMRPEDLFSNKELVEKWRSYYQQVLKNGPFTTEYKATADTLILQVSFNVIRRGEKLFAISAFGKDITERKKFERELKQKYNLLERVGESIGAGLAIIGKDYDIFWANSILKSEIVDGNKKRYQNFGKSDTICFDCGVKKVFEQNLPLEVHEYKTVDSKGETVWIELRVTPLKDNDGNVTAALELAVPITERKAAENKLRESQHLTEKILYCTPNLIYIYDLLENCYIYSNKEVLDFLGYSHEQIKSTGPQVV